MHERRFTLPTGEMAALEIGNEKTADLSVVFLHGWLDNAGSFKALMEQIHQLNPKLHLLAVDILATAYPVTNPATIITLFMITLPICISYWTNYRQTDSC